AISGRRGLQYGERGRIHRCRARYIRPACLRNASPASMCLSSNAPRHVDRQPRSRPLLADRRRDDMISAAPDGSPPMHASPFHLAWFLGNGFGVIGWNQLWGGTRAREWANPDVYIEIATALERARFDYLLIEDSLFIPDQYGGSMDFYLRRGLRAPKNDPLPLVPLIAHATRYLGIVPTVSTSFYPPFLLARLMATLDLMSKGRVGCNLVTSTSQRAAQNFGLDRHLDHDLRYEMADEF